MIAIGRVVDMPQNIEVIMVAVRPSKMVGFRPILSDVLPHNIAVVAWESEKTAEVIPAHFGISFRATPKLSIISGYHRVSK